LHSLLFQKPKEVMTYPPDLKLTKYTSYSQAYKREAQFCNSSAAVWISFHLSGTSSGELHITRTWHETAHLPGAESIRIQKIYVGKKNRTKI
jgi:hypothetical protein